MGARHNGQIPNKNRSTQRQRQRWRGQYRGQGKVSGTFPGSPIEPTFSFEIGDDGIKSLKIG